MPIILPTTQETKMLKQFTYTFAVTVPATTAEEGFQLLQDLIEEDVGVLFENIVDYEETTCMALPSKIKMATSKVGEA
tara:strand:+ start:143 stop:376 length:234 start_codon:yes stop_codon:yes gene_type:complete